MVLNITLTCLCNEYPGKPHLYRKSGVCWYSKIPILRPPLGLSKSGLKDHFLTVPKVVSNQRFTGCKK